MKVRYGASSLVQDSLQYGTCLVRVGAVSASSWEPSFLPLPSSPVRERSDREVMGSDGAHSTRIAALHLLAGCDVM